LISDRYCPDPPSPPENGGIYDWDVKMTGFTVYNTKVSYTCDVARIFENISAGESNNSAVPFYLTQVALT